MDTHLDITPAGPGIYDVKAVQGQVVTQHRLSVDRDYLERSGVDGTDLVRGVCDILVRHEALAAVPAEATLEQLAAHYPYLSSELEKSLTPGTPGFEPVEPARIVAEPAEDRPTHV